MQSIEYKLFISKFQFMLKSTSYIYQLYSICENNTTQNNLVTFSFLNLLNLHQIIQVQHYNLKLLNFQKQFKYYQNKRYFKPNFYIILEIRFVLAQLIQQHLINEYNQQLSRSFYCINSKSQ
ncbi:unnamed protein product [Paramecium pentaurelia]|uniref:Uncharacterized protein n=1 Tax=Paramecium pentaurelia TaxID=43138 RepID=A0A8S1YQL5_9CILI|nr:unnamed protein product [Paramecium pentaurelia]